ncbi:DUF2097 domain-containing protein [Methanobacterium alcaliphilum]|uniref:DUF2097 domain-containing protein n=1 Tax=Methanobacterium alcaliphilum TaxID=392018 RepID=UPI00200A0D42|nr:DUF2097 domain-containing protein [Methanobacterium alcaliphilum]MCK9151963.1 DUF2097 domain-containing protein [Methanobacterium alcaliphilum]
MEEEVIKVDCDEAIGYVKENVNVFDEVELSYNRIFTAGEVLNVDTSKYYGEHGVKIMVSIQGDTVSSSVEIDLVELKDDLIEIRHIPKNSDKSVLLLIERCEMDEE